jgi:XTP/dITP diphosphohydrolase
VNVSSIGAVRTGAASGYYAATKAALELMTEGLAAEVKPLGIKAMIVEPGAFRTHFYDTAKNNALLLRNLEGVADRRARFVCCCALVDPQGVEHVVAGSCEGRIAEAAAGVQGFGYDPLFIPDGFTESFAEISSERKNAISHRGRALAEVARVVKTQAGAAR